MTIHKARVDSLSRSSGQEASRAPRSTVERGDGTGEKSVTHGEQATVASVAAPPKRPPPSPPATPASTSPPTEARKASPLDEGEMEAAVCQYVCQGYGPTEIAALMSKEYGEKMSRQKPYTILQRAARKGFVRHVPPFHEGLRHKLLDRYGGILRDVEVIHTAVAEQVAHHGASQLLQIVRRLARPPMSRKVVQIGWSGGMMMMETAKVFSELLRQPVDGLPEKIVFRSLVSAFEMNNPSSDPNAFFTLFVKDPAMSVKTEFVCLQAPVTVPTKAYSDFLKSDGIQEALKGINDIDVVVTSGSCWDDKDSLYRKYMQRSTASARALEQAGIVADLMFLPLGPQGPLEVETEMRAMTLFQLRDLQRFIVQHGTRVLLVLGPCGLCKTPKTAVLKSLLSSKDPLITHLVVDSRTAGGLLSAAPVP